MANEINIQAALSLQRSSGALVGTGNLPVSQNGLNGVLNVQSITTTGGALSIGNVSFTSGGYLFVKNLDGTNYVEVGYDSGLTAFFSKLKASEFCLLPVDPGKTYYAKANGAPLYVQIAAVEP